LARERHIVAAAIHVHTIYSDGRGTVGEVVAAARAAGVGLVLVSDHETVQPLADGWEGCHQGVLVLVGTELRTDAGHLLALGLPASFQPPGRALQPALAAIRRAGGLAFAVFPGHPFLGWDAGRLGGNPALPSGLTGLEV